MKVMCLYNGEVDGAMDSKVNLTPGKIYEVLGDRVSQSDFVFRIVNDIGKEGNYHHMRFKHIDEVREEKLKELGI
jgi:hypothetical protein